MTNIITTREQVEAIENGSVLSDVQGCTVIRNHEGEFLLYAREQDAWVAIGADEIAGDYHDEDAPYLPMQLLTVIPASLMRSDFQTTTL